MFWYFQKNVRSRVSAASRSVQPFYPLRELVHPIVAIQTTDTYKDDHSHPKVLQ